MLLLCCVKFFFKKLLVLYNILTLLYWGCNIYTTVQGWSGLWECYTSFIWLSCILSAWFHPCMKQHSAFSDFVPKCSDVIIFPFKKTWTLPVDDKWIRTILNLVSKEIAWGTLRLFFCLVFCLCANMNCAPLLFNNISPLSPAVSHVKIVKYVCNCRSKK